MDLVGMLDEVGPVPQPLALRVQTEDHAACAMLCATWYIYASTLNRETYGISRQTRELKSHSKMQNYRNNIFMFRFKVNHSF